MFRPLIFQIFSNLTTSWIQAGVNGERLNILEERVAELEMELEKCKAEIEASRGPSPGLLVSSQAQYHGA